MICISIGNRALLNQVNELQPGLVELRYDMIGKMPSAVSGLVTSSVKQLATCRPGSIPDAERLEILKSAIQLGADYVDVEIESSQSFINEIRTRAREMGTALIVSYHNYGSTPELPELKRILASCYQAGADIAKIACQVNSQKDSARLMSLYGEEGKKVVIGMGSLGKITRIAALELGAEFTFAALSEMDITAPGQLSFRKMNEINNQIHSS